MCGIVGYIGQSEAKTYLLDGLESLEYRGYDSAGISTIDKSVLTTLRVVGRVEHLRASEQAKPVRGKIGIGHTRWATHGSPLERNAHPHMDNLKEFSVVHNGIIENYQEIRTFLEAEGITFHSDTDTEVVPNLVAYNYKVSKDITKAFVATIQSLRGAYALVMVTVHDPGALYSAKLSSPLAIGVGDGENYIGSDAVPIIPHTKDIVYLEDGEIAIVKSDGYRIINSTTEEEVDRPTELVEIEEESASKGNYADFMSKEIYESPQTVRSAMLGRVRVEEQIIKLGGLELVQAQLAHIDRIIILGCGTSFYAGMVGEYLLEEIANIPVEVQYASEFRYRTEPLSRSTAVLVVSQSGETADTIAALKKLEGSGVLTLGVVNAPGSTLARLTDAGVYCHAGPEKAVASTKAFISQVTILAMIALNLSKYYPKYSEMIHELDKLPGYLEEVLKQADEIKKVAKKYAHHRDFLFIGRRYTYPVALEGALKLKEVSYIHAEGYAAGEMKHGPLALIDENFPTFAIALSNEIDEKLISNMQEIKSRKGPILSVVDNKDSEAAKISDDYIVVPRVIEQLQPVISAVVTHLFAYYVASELGRDIDRPRNLAKSVTVE